jgi:hypothetical protein
MLAAALFGASVSTPVAWHPWLALAGFALLGLVAVRRAVSS